MTGFAILGCGRIGRMHARNIKAHPRGDLVTCYDVAETAATETAAELGVAQARSAAAARALFCNLRRAVSRNDDP